MADDLLGLEAEASRVRVALRRAAARGDLSPHRLGVLAVGVTPGRPHLVIDLTGVSATAAFRIAQAVELAVMEHAPAPPPGITDPRVVTPLPRARAPI